MNSPAANNPDGNRRGFLAASATVILAGAAYATPAVAGLVAFLNPWRQKSQAGQMVRVASLAALPVQGAPQRFPVIADRSDAWNYYPAEPIGVVFLHRTGENEVVAFQSICPHAGCMVTWNEKTDGFYCPCHAAYFDINGDRTEKSSMSPRNLDTLDVEIRDGKDVWVKFEKFQTGTPDKIVKS